MTRRVSNHPTPDNEDVFLWPDGTWCHRYEYGEMSHMSDDFEVLPFESDRWRELNALPTIQITIGCESGKRMIFRIGRTVIAHCADGGRYTRLFSDEFQAESAVANLASIYPPSWVKSE